MGSAPCGAGVAPSGRAGSLVRKRAVRTRSFLTIKRIPFGQPVSMFPVSSASQAPSRIPPPGSTAGVQAEDGTLSTRNGVGDGHADRVRQPPSAPGEPGHELVGAAAGFGTDERLASAPV